METLKVRFLVPGKLRNTDTSEVSKHISREVNNYLIGKSLEEPRNKNEIQQKIEKQKDDIFQKFSKHFDSEVDFEKMKDLKIEISGFQHDNSGGHHPWDIRYTLQSIPYILVEILSDRTFVYFNPDSEDKKLFFSRNTGLDVEVIG